MGIRACPGGARSQPVRFSAATAISRKFRETLRTGRRNPAERTGSRVHCERISNWFFCSVILQPYARWSPRSTLRPSFSGRGLTSHSPGCVTDWKRPSLQSESQG